MDRSEYLREIKENIEYPFLCQQFNADDVDEVVGLMADVMCSTQSTVRIGGENIPLSQVQARFYRLDYGALSPPRRKPFAAARFGTPSSPSMTV